MTGTQKPILFRIVLNRATQMRASRREGRHWSGRLVSIGRFVRSPNQPDADDFQQ